MLLKVVYFILTFFVISLLTGPVAFRLIPDPPACLQQASESKEKHVAIARRFKNPGLAESSQEELKFALECGAHKDRWNNIFRGAFNLYSLAVGLASLACIVFGPKLVGKIVGRTRS